MNSQAQRLVRSALALIESTRFRIGVNRFLKDFIDTWAFMQTGMYPPQVALPSDLQESAGDLSHLLSKAMKIDPTSDILGLVFSESGFYGYTDLMVDGAPSPHQSDTTLRWLIDRLRS